MALSLAKRQGALGPAPVADLIAHSQGFVSALAAVHGTVVDLGAGGGVPGLVIATERPDLELVLVDRRTSRADLLQRLIAQLGLGARVRTVCAAASALPGEPWLPVDAVVARRLGPPHETIAFARALVRNGGLIVISEPPVGDRWSPGIVGALGLRQLHGQSPPPPDAGRVAVFERST